MSNRAQVIRTTFIDYDGTKTEGVRAFDDYEQTYLHLDEVPKDDLELLKLVLHSEDDRVLGIFEHLFSIEKGVGIDDKWYDYSEIDSILDEFFNKS